MSEARPYVYVSTRAGADPVRCVLLCAPDAVAHSMEALAAFAEASGWVDEVERDGGVLVAPVVTEGWAQTDSESIRSCYLQTRGMLVAPSRVSLPGRGGALWAWEPLICVAGYEEGAEAAARLLVEHPSFAAATLVVDGCTQDLSAGERPSDHWHVSRPSDTYAARNREVPVAAWLCGTAVDERLVAHLRAAEGPSWSLRTSPELTGADPQIARRAMREFFCHVMRWKNAPDGTLSWRQTREEFYLGERFVHGSVESGGNAYHYAVHVPAGLTPDGARGLPIVFSIHGRGEPAWIFADKNGWEDLADETGAFVVVVPDSPRNVWSQDRDADVLALIIDAVVQDFGCDRERVYLSGFSNGAAYTYQQATTRPWLFAAASPWNCPPEEAIVGSGLGSCLYAPDAQEQGFEMPLWIVAGDSDDKGVADRSCDLPQALPLGRCMRQSEQVWDGTNHYTAEAGYAQGERLRTSVYANDEGGIRLGITQVRDMPHGAIADEARAAWEFMRRFRRVENNKNVEEVGQ